MALNFVKKIKASEVTNHIPVVLLTAKVTDNSKVEGYKSGADSYITKPFSSQVLLARVENLIMQRKNPQGIICFWGMGRTVQYSRFP